MESMVRPPFKNKVPALRLTGARHAPVSVPDLKLRHVETTIPNNLSLKNSKSDMCRSKEAFHFNMIDG